MAGATESMSLTELSAWAQRTGQDLHTLDLRKAWSQVKVLMRSSILQNFASGTAPNGETWAPLKRPRRNSKGGDKPLRDTGRLMAASTGNVEETSSTFVMSNNLEYARIHQEGGNILIPARQQTLLFRRQKGGQTLFTRQSGKAKKGDFSKRASVGAHTVNIPARPYMGFKPADIDGIARIIAETLGEKIQ